MLPGRVLAELVENDRVIGGITAACSARAEELYGIFCKGEFHLTNARTAEMCKLTENAFRDVNIAFANELSIVCDKLGIDVWELIRLANHHPRVNILQPGPGVGGHCIAVDPWFIVAAAPEEARLIRTAREVNDGKPRIVLDRIKAAVAETSAVGRPTVALLGLAFKADVDDLRESPALAIAESGRRLGKLRCDRVGAEHSRPARFARRSHTTSAYRMTFTTAIAEAAIRGAAGQSPAIQRCQAAGAGRQDPHRHARSLVVKQLLVSSGKVFLKEVPAPTVGPKNILVGVERSCVSVGTEMAGIKMSGLPLYRRALKQPHHVKKALQMMKDQGFARVYKQIKGKLDARPADRLLRRRDCPRGRFARSTASRSATVSPAPAPALPTTPRSSMCRSTCRFGFPMIWGSTPPRP